MITAPFRYGLPTDIEAERWVIGLVLLHAENYPKVATMICDHQFSVDSHKLIWGALAALCEAGAHVDYGTVYRELERRGALTSSLNLGYLMELTEKMPMAPNVEAYATIVQSCALRREAAMELYYAAERLCEPGADLSQIEKAQSVLQNIGVKAVKAEDARTFHEVVDSDGFMDPHLAEPGISTPWPGLDRLTGGFSPGQLIILAARPAVGKSTMAVQMAVHAAENGIGVVLFSLEMSATLIARRLIAGRAGVDLSAWSRGLLDRDERRLVASQRKALDGLPLWLYDQANATIASIRAALLRVRAKRDVGLVVVDYLQLIGSMRSRSSGSRNDEVSEISRGLKVLAMEIGIPILALSQLSRAGERDNRAPRLSDLRDSGSIEQDADMVGFLHRNDDPSAGDMVDLRLAKNRAGAVGKVSLLFEASRARFTCQ